MPAFWLCFLTCHIAKVWARKLGFKKKKKKTLVLLGINGLKAAVSGVKVTYLVELPIQANHLPKMFRPHPTTSPAPQSQYKRITENVNANTGSF